MLEEVPQKLVVIYSGGMDSTVLLYQLMQAGSQIHALSFNYGQRHVKELDAAKKICNHLQIPHQTADLSGIVHLLGGSSLTSDNIAVPEGHYTEEIMKATVVPNRNMIMLSIAAGYAISLKYDAVAYAAHSGDHTIYPDCRREFADAIDHVFQLADWHAVRLFRPYVHLDKAAIARLGAALDVPFASTWSCYQGRASHCGRCGTCIERREAMHLAGLIDSTVYEPEAPDIQALIKSNWHF